MIERLRNYFKLREYKSSPQCRKLDYYIKRIRRDGLHAISEEEYKNMQDLIDKEREFYSSLNTQ